ncbi:TetR/AcrR family transcriptional regulator [Gordonia sp. TBRC 11910]|uniref:TetR/AcrR family transcriptional regulator n=1 Tax=Gordonia asplenii TaxID=2725283 RepID=A0A848L364_9ACTN|nr:TetR/AcrR family transcriptional regulator [Gordonia asplenii]NMO05274.1 TetR/AcrR family transcriptional regulator [Gordonia asplenii]
MNADQLATVRSEVRLRYLDAGLRILGIKGYASLKLATLCREVGVSTGAFYYAFGNWDDYTVSLIEYWREEVAFRLVNAASAYATARERLEFLRDVVHRLPHDTEAAIRIWAAHDPRVAAIQSEVDDARRALVAGVFRDIAPGLASVDDYAAAAVDQLVGYQNGTRRSREALNCFLEAIVNQVTFEANPCYLTFRCEPGATHTRPAGEES